MGMLYGSSSAKWLFPLSACSCLQIRSTGRRTWQKSWCCTMTLRRVASLLPEACSTYHCTTEHRNQVQHSHQDRCKLVRGACHVPCGLRWCASSRFPPGSTRRLHGTVHEVQAARPVPGAEDEQNPQFPCREAKHRPGLLPCASSTWVVVTVAHSPC